MAATLVGRIRRAIHFGTAQICSAHPISSIWNTLARVIRITVRLAIFAGQIALIKQIHLAWTPPQLPVTKRTFGTVSKVIFALASFIWFIHIDVFGDLFAFKRPPEKKENCSQDNQYYLEY
jgi:hypothetical protein